MSVAKRGGGRLEKMDNGDIVGEDDEVFSFAFRCGPGLPRSLPPIDVVFQQDGGTGGGSGPFQRASDDVLAKRK